MDTCQFCGNDDATYHLCGDCLEAPKEYLPMPTTDPFDPGPRTLEPRYTLAELDEAVNALALDLLRMHAEEAINLHVWPAASTLVTAAGYERPTTAGV